MKLQRPSPGMEDSGETRQIGAEETVVFGTESQGFGKGMKEGFIAGFLMETDKGKSN